MGYSKASGQYARKRTTPGLPPRRKPRGKRGTLALSVEERRALGVLVPHLGGVFAVIVLVILWNI